MKRKSILVCLFVFSLMTGLMTVSSDAATPRRTAQKARTSTVKKSPELPGTLGRDVFTSIVRKVNLKYTGNDEDNAKYVTYDINIKWPTDIRLSGTGGSGAIAEMNRHKSRVEEIQALMAYALLDEYGTSDIKSEINKLIAPDKNYKVVKSVPSSAYDLMSEFPPADVKISVKPYMSCNKWICFELQNITTQGNGCDGNTKWIIIPRNQALWKRTDITLISALQYSNYTDKVGSPHLNRILALIKTAAQKDGSFEWIRNGNNVSVPDAIRPEKTGLSFIYYLHRCSNIDVFVSYEKLKPYIDAYDILAGGTWWVKY